jgi:hypothetical protein
MDHKRLFESSNAPTPDELRTPVGWGQMGSSTTSLFEDEHSVTIRPVAIPVKSVGVWSYACLVAFIVGGMLFPFFGFQRPDPIFWGMMVLGGLLVIPSMLGIFAWANGQMGSSPYLIMNKIDQSIELPRLGAKWPTKAVQGVCFVRCYVDRNPLFQVSLLIQGECGKWTYAHVYNAGGDNHRNAWMHGFGLGEDQELAKKLGAGWSYLRFRPDGTLVQQKTMDNHAANGSSR